MIGKEDDVPDADQELKNLIGGAINRAIEKSNFKVEEVESRQVEEIISKRDKPRVRNYLRQGRTIKLVAQKLRISPIRILGIQKEMMEMKRYEAERIRGNQAES